MGQDILVRPGGLVTSKPAHLIGLRGAAPTVYNTSRSGSAPMQQAGTYDGFQNLLSINGDVAWSLLNGSTDAKSTAGTAALFLGGNTKGSGDNVDVVTQQLLASILSLPIIEGSGAIRQKLNVSGEISVGAATDGTIYGAYAELFTTAGTVTVTAASNVIVGAGTAWTTDLLAGGYGYAAARISLNTIRPGDIIGVNAAGTRIWFRIIAVTDNTHFTVYPTPQSGNPAIGAGKAYIVIRTGYGSHSRAVTLPGLGGGMNADVHTYYAGNVLNSDDYGSVEEVTSAATIAIPSGHHMAPWTVDTAGAAVARLEADDIAYYKSFLVYGSGNKIGWSIAGFPSAFPFGQNDFPAQNVAVLDATSRFVSLEFLGDNLVAIYEDAMFAVVATGAVPEFVTYHMDETLSVQNAAKTEPCGITNGLIYGRPTCSGRGAIYYMSNRGLERLPGVSALADEISRPISDAVSSMLGANPYFLSWDDAFDTVWIRRAFGGTLGPQDATDAALVFAAATGDWSTVILSQVTGSAVAAITAGAAPKTHQNDSVRLLHLAYYEVVSASGTPGTDGGNVRVLQTGLDRVIQTPGLVPWIWNTPIIPLGLSYPDFSFGGFVIDAMTVDPAGSPVGITWSIYSGSSPYNLTLRDTNVVAFTGSVKSTWVSSRAKLGEKRDDAFIQIRLTSTTWVQLAGIILFESKSKAKR